MEMGILASSISKYDEQKFINSLYIFFVDLANDESIKRSRVQVDARLPITRSILHRMLVALPYICSSPFYQILYRSMFLLAFYGFLRVGEMTRN
jgi:hypothetical protein